MYIIVGVFNPILILVQTSVPLLYTYTLTSIYTSNGKADSIRQEADTISSFLYNTTTVRDTAFKGQTVASTTTTYTDVSTGIDQQTDSETAKRSTRSTTEPYKLHYIVHCINYETSQPYDVLITNGMTPNEYTASLYKKAKKIRRSIPVLTKLLEQAMSQAAYLLDIQTSIDALRSYNK